MSDSPIKFPSSPSSSEDDLPTHQSFEEDVSSDDWMPPWSSEKEDPEEEEEEDEDEDDADADAEDDDDDSDSDFASPRPKRARFK